MTHELSGRTLGPLLREWRVRRRMSQLELASDVGISTKHLSFLETGRSRPSRQMLLRLAACLDVPLRYRNSMLNAAGFPSIFEEKALGAPDMDLVRRNVEAILAAHDPNPALAVDRHWTMIAANRAVAYLFAGAEPILLRPPVNVMRLLLHPAGMAARIINLAEWRAHAITRLRRQIDSNGDTGLMELLEEIREYPNVPVQDPLAERPEPDLLAIPLRVATMDGVMSFHGTTTSFSIPIDITVSELSIEAFLPADGQTAESMRRALGSDDARPLPRSFAAGDVAGAMV